jgi:hypothetical protein
MPEDVAGTVERLRARRDEARTARIRAEHAREQAEAGVTQAIEALRFEFGVETSDQARNLLGEFDLKIAAEVQVIEQALGGGS